MSDEPDDSGDPIARYGALFERARKVQVAARVFHDFADLLPALHDGADRQVTRRRDKP